MSKKEKTLQSGISTLQKARQCVSRPLTDKDREVGRLFFSAASVEVLVDEASLYCNLQDAPKVEKLLDVLKVSHGAPKEVARVKGTCIIGANVRLLVDILWTVQVFLSRCTIDVEAFDVDVADQVISYWGLKLGKTMTQSYRFFGALILNQIMRCDEPGDAVDDTEESEEVVASEVDLTPMEEEVPVTA